MIHLDGASLRRIQLLGLPLGQQRQDVWLAASTLGLLHHRLFDLLCLGLLQGTGHTLSQHVGLLVHLQRFLLSRLLLLLCGLSTRCLHFGSRPTLAASRSRSLPSCSCLTAGASSRKYIVGILRLL